jgi:hypothetical protein
MPLVQIGAQKAPLMRRTVSPQDDCLMAVSLQKFDGFIAPL